MQAEDLTRLLVWGMGKVRSGRELLPDAARLALLNVEKSEQGCWIEAAPAFGYGAPHSSSIPLHSSGRREAAPDNSACPDCGVLSTARYSSYWRNLKDLPVQGQRSK
jgi:hypothetical protein